MLRCLCEKQNSSLGAAAHVEQNHPNFTCDSFDTNFWVVLKEGGVGGEHHDILKRKPTIGISHPS